MSRTVKRNKASKYLSRKFESKYKKLANPYKTPLITELVSRVDNYRVEHPDEKVTDTLLDRIFDEGIETFNSLFDHAIRKNETLAARKQRDWGERKEQISDHKKQLSAGEKVLERGRQILEKRKGGRKAIPKKPEDASEQSPLRRAVDTRKQLSAGEKVLERGREILEKRKPIPKKKIEEEKEKIEESGLSGYADKVFTEVFGTPFDTTIGDLMDRLNIDSERFPKAVEASYEILTKDLEKLDDGATKSEIDNLVETVLKIGDDMGKIIRGSESSPPPKEEIEDTREEEKEIAGTPDVEPSPASSIGDALKTKAKDFISEKIGSEISKRTGVPRSVFDPAIRRIGAPPKVPRVASDPPRVPRASEPLPRPDQSKKKPKMFDEVELKFGDAGVKPGSKLTNNPEGYDENTSVTKAVRYDDKFPEIPYDDTRSARISLGMIKNPVRNPFKLSLLSRKPMIPFNGQVLEDGRDAQEAISISQTENFGRLPDYDRVRPETLSMYGNIAYRRQPMLGY